MRAAQRVFAGRHARHGEALLREVVLDELEDLLLVVDHQHVFGPW